MTNDVKQNKRIKRAQNLSYYPLALNIKGQEAVVVGGGKVALMKAQALIDAGAKMTIVSPEVIAELDDLIKSNTVQWIARKVKSADLDGCCIVIAATSSQEVNEQVSTWARKKKILINVVDQPDLSDFISPAVLRKEQAIVCVYTNGVSPSLSRDIKNFLDQGWDQIRA